MPICPQCDRAVPAETVRCPHCNETLKAFGHSGIPLHRARDDRALCESCLYDADDSCTFPQRPEAKTCTLYRNLAEASTSPESERPVRSRGLKDRSRGFIIAAVLLGLSFWLALR